MEHQLDVDLLSHLVADLTRDSFEDVFELLLIAVDVSADGPDQFEAIKQRGKSLFNHDETALTQESELTLKGLQEL